MMQPLMVFYTERDRPLSVDERARLGLAIDTVQYAMFEAAGRGAPIPVCPVVWFHASVSEPPRTLDEVCSGIEVRAVIR
jgi:hypothetical protein